MDWGDHPKESAEMIPGHAAYPMEIHGYTRLQQYLMGLHFLLVCLVKSVYNYLKRFYSGDIHA